ncbi:MAG: OadG-related small transporter subunit [Planctomycetota bacterium]
MENLEFGLSLALVGMGGTLVGLYLLGLISNLLLKIFPVKSRSADKENK